MKKRATVLGSKLIKVTLPLLLMVAMAMATTAASATGVRADGREDKDPRASDVMLRELYHGIVDGYHQTAGYVRGWFTEIGKHNWWWF